MRPRSHVTRLFDCICIAPQSYKTWAGQNGADRLIHG
jgi:hypothetical protein